MASTALLMDKTAQEQQQQQQQTGQQPLKCPRCDSSNTKFCYYNNYSLSQPRHFCKSCKRYWTRGGTLRNVPVGGGCRKNKRLRRPSCATRILEAATPPHSSSSSAVLAPTNHNPPVLPQIDLNPIFYGLPTNAPEFPFSGRFSDLTSSTAGYELSHSSVVSGVGFSSDSSNPISPIFGSFSSSAATPTIASLLASTFIPQKLVNKTASRVGSFQALAVPFHQQDQLQMSRENSNDIKVEQGQWNNISGCQNPMEPQAGLSDPFMFWNVTNSSSTIGASQFLL